MQVIPVIDLMQGQVVRGVGGQRTQYRAIQSVLASDAQPSTVAQAFVGCGFRQAYVADLDAIGGAAPAWNMYRQLMQSELSLWVDAGLVSAEGAREMAEFRHDGRPLSGVVAGLESVPDASTLRAMVAAVGPERLIFSLDLKAAAPLCGAAAWRGLQPLQIATMALRVGVRRMIVLDLARVGMGSGVGTEPLCRQLRAMDDKLQIIAGGGVRSGADLRSLAAAGCDAALVASALHDGRLTPGECVAGV